MALTDVLCGPWTVARFQRCNHGAAQARVGQRHYWSLPCEAPEYQSGGGSGEVHPQSKRQSIADSTSSAVSSSLRGSRTANPKPAERAASAERRSYSARISIPLAAPNCGSRHAKQCRTPEASQSSQGATTAIPRALAARIHSLRRRSGHDIILLSNARVQRRHANV